MSSTAFKDIQDDYFWTKKHKSTVPLQKNIQTPTIYITAQYLLHRIKTNGKNVISCFKQTAAFPWFSQTKKNIFQCRLFHQTSGFRDCHLNVAGTWGSVWKNPSISKVNRDDSWSFLLGRTCLIVVLKGNQELQTGNQFDANAYLRTIGIIWEFAHTFWRVNSNWEKCMFSMWTVSSPTTSNKNRVVAPNLKQN